MYYGIRIKIKTVSNPRNPAIIINRLFFCGKSIFFSIPHNLLKKKYKTVFCFSAFFRAFSTETQRTQRDTEIYIHNS